MIGRFKVQHSVDPDAQPFAGFADVVTAKR